MTRLPGYTSGRMAKPSLPLTRNSTNFVPPKPRNVDVPLSSCSSIKGQSSSLTPIESEYHDEDEAAEDELPMGDMKIKGKKKEADPTKDLDTAQSVLLTNKLHPTVPFSAETVLKLVQQFAEDLKNSQTRLETFITEADTRLLKLEEKLLNRQDLNQDWQTLRSEIQELKNDMADRRNSGAVTTQGDEPAGSFGDYNNQRARSQSRLDRFTQLDSDAESTPKQKTIDPKILPQPSIEPPSNSPSDFPSSPPPSSTPQVLAVDSPLPQAEDLLDPKGGYRTDFLRSLSVDPGDNLETVVPDSPVPEVDVTATFSQYPHSSPVEGPSSDLYIPDGESTDTASFCDSTSAALRPSNSVRAATTAANRPQRHRPTTFREQSSDQPSHKRHKSVKSVKTNTGTLKKRKSLGPTGSLPKGTLAKSGGHVRVKGAKWPTLGPNTVVGLGGNIECEQCLGPVHRSCAGLMDNEEIPNLSWICPDCDHLQQQGGTVLPTVQDTMTCIRPTCIRRRHVKVEWKAADAELYVIKQAIGRRPIQQGREWSKGKYEYLTSWYGYPLEESTWEPIESFVAAEEMTGQFVQAAKKENVDLDTMGQDVILLEEAKAAFDENGDLRM